MENKKLLHKYQNALSAAQNTQRFYQAYICKTKDTLDYEMAATATVKEFELAYETFWKYLKFYLEYQGILDVPSSPRPVFIVALQYNIITENEVVQLGESVGARNIATHLYAQESAEEILQNVLDYSTLFLTILGRLAIKE
jgi:nucleotidyltransferase substrate binding protein (TIGR01987 family)